jgi:hypothetical protein
MDRRSLVTTAEEETRELREIHFLCPSVLTDDLPFYLPIRALFQEEKIASGFAMSLWDGPFRLGRYRVHKQHLSRIVAMLNCEHSVECVALNARWFASFFLWRSAS